MADQNDDGKNSNKRRHPSVTDEASGAGMSGGDSPLKKGPWSADEDKILQDYVRDYGARNWDSIKKCTRLRRSGPSCRCRWVYRLRPGLKKGAITRDEDKLIAELNANMGNKWAKIAAKLPGRTDHEIRNYWTVRERKLKSRNRPMESETKSAGEKIPEPISLCTQYDSNKRRRLSVTDGDSPLKKGPWSADEDEILQEYVRKYGARNWDSIKKCTRLRRNGKSCRFRWVNQLRPDLKKSAITRDEEQLIAKLHAKMGNKWVKIAAELPGRTDNEIKNYWNLRENRWKSRNVPLNQAGSQGCQNMGTVQPVGQWISNANFDMRAASTLKQGISSPNSQSFSQTDAADRSSTTPSQANPNTPFGQSASSSFSESTPVSGTSSSYDPGFFVNHEAVVDQASTQQTEEKSNSEQTDISGTNVLPGPLPHQG